MRTVCLVTILTVMAGCASTGPVAYREDPLARSNPALLNCAPRQAPVCQAYGGRTGKHLYNCSCR